MHEAITDEACRAPVDGFWDEVDRHLAAAGLVLTEYRSRPIARFLNPRMTHRLDQSAAVSLAKLRVRVVPVSLREQAAGHMATGCAAAVGARIAVLLTGAMRMGGSASKSEIIDRPADVAHFTACLNPTLAQDADLLTETETETEAVVRVRSVLPSTGLRPGLPAAVTGPAV